MKEYDDCAYGHPFRRAYPRNWLRLEKRYAPLRRARRSHLSARVEKVS